MTSVILISIGCGLVTGCHSGSGSGAVGLALVPSQATEVYYTDWAAWKKRLGLSDVTSASAEDRRRAFGTATNGVDVVLSGGTLFPYAEVMASQLGWSSYDEDADLSYLAGGAPVTIVAMRKDLDLGTVVTSLTKRGYRSSGAGSGTTILTRTSLGTDPDFPSVALGQVAVIPDKHLVIFTADTDAGALDPVRSLVAGKGSSLAEDSRVKPVADAVDSSLATTLEVGSNACPTLGKNLSATQQSELRKRYVQLATIHRFDALAAIVAGSAKPSFPLDTSFSFVYPDSASASADVAARQKLATTGTSQALQEPYSSLFSVTKVHADGNRLELDVDFHGKAHTLENMVTRQDLLFAACP